MATDSNKEDPKEYCVDDLAAALESIEEFHFKAVVIVGETEWPITGVLIDHANERVVLQW